MDLLVTKYISKHSRQVSRNLRQCVRFIEICRGYRCWLTPFVKGGRISMKSFHCPILSKPQLLRFTLHTGSVDFRDVVWRAEILIGRKERHLWTLFVSGFECVTRLRCSGVELARAAPSISGEFERWSRSMVWCREYFVGSYCRVCTAIDNPARLKAENQRNMKYTLELY